MRLRTILIAFIAVLILLIVAILVLPWKGMVEQKIIAMLEAKGFVSPTLTIDRIGTRGLVLRDVSVGNPALKLTTLTLAYNPRAAINGRIDDVEINGLNIRATQADAGWQVDGMETLLKKDKSNKPVTIPVTLAELNQLPLHSVSIREADLTLIGKGWQADMPLEGKLQQGTDGSIHFESKNARVAMDKDSVALGAITLDLKLDDAKKQWLGTWAIKDIVATSETLTLPPLQAGGEVIVASDTIDATAKITSADKSHTMTLNVHYAFNKPETSFVTVLHAQMPLSGGNIAVNTIRIPITGNKPITLKLEVSKVAMDSVMDGLTGSKATATGAISGEIPMTIGRDGSFRIGNSALTADGPGQIALAPDVIPGDNPQVALVRDILKNLQYSVLALGLDMSPDRQLKAVLVVEGKNPDIENGRAIKLKVQLSGDLLNLLLQNLKLMTDPKTFIEQSSHEKL